MKPLVGGRRRSPLVEKVSRANPFRLDGKFEAGDRRGKLALLLVFLVFGTIEAIRVFRERNDDANGHA
jgi:hypothetical protein